MPKIKLSDEDVEIQYASWIKMVIDLISPKNLYLVGGRGVAKSTDILAERSIQIIYDMPRSTIAFIADTYVNLLSNVLPAIREGWERKKFYEKLHYVIDKQPPDAWEKPLTPTGFFKHTISCFNGTKLILKSLDRPSINAGISVAHHIGDEAKHLKKDKLDSFFPTLRGDAAALSRSPFFLGQTFTTDMPNTALGDDAWILDMEKYMDKKQMITIIQTALVVNDIQLQILYAHKQGKSERTISNLERNLATWTERLRKMRFGSTFFYRVSSFANADFLGVEYFQNLLKVLQEDGFKPAVLSLAGTLQKDQRFYWALSERNFYYDSYNYEYYDRFGLMDNITQSSKGLKHCQHDKPLEAGFDAGNMMSLIVGQDQGKILRGLKFFYTLPPEFIDELGAKFVEFFSEHKYKILNLYYDRSANNYAKVKRDFATNLKNAIEKHDGKPTGWTVMLMSLNQGNIEMAEEYKLVNAMLTGRNPNLPMLMIDAYECKEIKSSLELAPADKSKGKIVKVKKSEKYTPKRLPMESTNPSDALKYWVCRRKFMNIVSGSTVTIGDPVVR